jgi:hypothetical protein
MPPNITLLQDVALKVKFCVIWEHCKICISHKDKNKLFQDKILGEFIERIFANREFLANSDGLKCFQAVFFTVYTLYKRFLKYNFLKIQNQPLTVLLT